MNEHAILYRKMEGIEGGSESLQQGKSGFASSKPRDCNRQSGGWRILNTTEYMFFNGF